MNEETRAGGDRRIDELTERAADDVAALAHAYSNVAKREVVSAGERAMWPAAVAAVGGLLAVVGAGMLVASPAVPSTNNRLKRRMRLVSIVYLALGAIGGVAGGGALIATMRNALPRTRRNLQEAVEVLREKV